MDMVSEGYTRAELEAALANAKAKGATEDVKNLESTLAGSSSTQSDQESPSSNLANRSDVEKALANAKAKGATEDAKALEDWLSQDNVHPNQTPIDTPLQQDLARDVAAETGAQPAPPTEYSSNIDAIGHRVVGAGETALALGTGATTGLAGGLAGGAVNLGALLLGHAANLISGKATVPTLEDVGNDIQYVAQGINTGANAFTYQPKTEEGQQYTENVGKVLQYAPIVGALSPELAIAGRAAGRLGGVAAEGFRAGREVPPEALTGITPPAGAGIPPEAPAGGTGTPPPPEAPASAARPTEAPYRPEDAHLNNFENIPPELKQIVEPKAFAGTIEPVKENSKANISYTEARNAGELDLPVTLNEPVDIINRIMENPKTTPAEIDTLQRTSNDFINHGMAERDASGNLVPKPVTLSEARDFTRRLRETENPVNDTASIKNNNEILNATHKELASDTVGGPNWRAFVEHSNKVTKALDNHSFMTDLLTGDFKPELANRVFDKVIQEPTQTASNLGLATAKLRNSGEPGILALQEAKAQTLQDLNSHLVDRDIPAFRSAVENLRAKDANGATKFQVLFGRELGGRMANEFNTYLKIAESQEGKYPASLETDVLNRVKRVFSEGHNQRVEPVTPQAAEAPRAESATPETPRQAASEAPQAAEATPKRGFAYRAGQSAGEAANKADEMAAKARSSFARAPEESTVARDADAAARQARAQGLPVPIELTTAQKTLKLEDTNFEHTTAAKEKEGKAFREKFNDQNSQIRQNFEHFIKDAGSHTQDRVELGDHVKEALTNAAKKDRDTVRELYAKADSAPEAKNLVELDRLGDHFNELERGAELANGSTVIKNAIKDAEKLGIYKLNKTTGLSEPAKITVADAELYRKSLSDSVTNETSPSDKRAIATFIKAIDANLDEHGGNIYKEARAARTKYGKDFENENIIERILGQKKRSTTDNVASEHVLEKAVLNKSATLEDLKELKRLLPKDTWDEVKGQTVQWMHDEAFKGSKKNEKGERVANLTKFDSAVTRLDESKKLDFIFGEKTAADIRLLRDVAEDVLTHPEGTTGFAVGPEIVATVIDTTLWGFTGFPIPLAHGIRWLNSVRKNYQSNKRTARHLKGL